MKKETAGKEEKKCNTNKIIRKEKKQMKEVFFKKCTEENKRRRSTEKRRKMAIRRKAAIVAVLILLMSFGTNVQAYAAGDAYAYELVDRVKSESVKDDDNTTYSSIEGLALGDKDGKAYVLKTNGKKLNQGICMYQGLVVRRDPA